MVPDITFTQFQKQSTPKVPFAPYCNTSANSLNQQVAPTLSWLEAIDSYSSKTAKQKILGLVHT